MHALRLIPPDLTYMILWYETSAKKCRAWPLKQSAHSLLADKQALVDVSSAKAALGSWFVTGVCRRSKIDKFSVQ